MSAITGLLRKNALVLAPSSRAASLIPSGNSRNATDITPGGVQCQECAIGTSVGALITSLSPPPCVRDSNALSSETTCTAPTIVPWALRLSERELEPLSLPTSFRRSNKSPCWTCDQGVHNARHPSETLTASLIPAQGNALGLWAQKNIRALKARFITPALMPSHDYEAGPWPAMMKWPVNPGRCPGLV